jgi:hypothetical protein
MKNFIQDPLKVFLSIIGILFLTCLIFLSSCTERNRRNSFEEAEASLSPTQIVNHSAKPIIIETLYKGNIKSGIYKIKVDSSEYIIINDYDALAIAKHK